MIKLPVYTASSISGTFSDKLSTDATPLPLTERIEAQNAESVNMICNKTAAIPPQLHKGDINKFRFQEALLKRKQNPEAFQEMLTKKRRMELGRSEVTVRRIPDDWTELKIKNVMLAYGEVSFFG